MRVVNSDFPLCLPDTPWLIGGVISVKKTDKTPQADGGEGVEMPKEKIYELNYIIYKGLYLPFYAFR